MTSSAASLANHTDAAPVMQFSYVFARRNRLLVKPQDAQAPVVVWHVGPPPVDLLGELSYRLAQPFTFEALTETEFERQFAQVFTHDSSVSQDVVGELNQQDDLSIIHETLNQPVDLLEADDQAPIIRLINALLSEAVREQASDVHLETFENRMLVRFRIDGVLREVLEPPRTLSAVIISRVKVMANLDIAEKRVPQDGRISLRLAGRAVDVRVSTLPSGQGERVVMRLLDKDSGKLKLATLGVPESVLPRITELVHRPHGIMLVTGPTGSGKTTTLYAALNEINDLSRNILTVEDPIEYYFDGIGQTQVNTRTGMTFARGLRAILRQDPDVVMVGEIRDTETAQIAVQASLTGHLVLSTLHTNTAIGAIARLQDMQVEPFLLASSLIGVLAQRLVRRLDPELAEAYTPGPAECRMLGVDAANPPTLYRPAEQLPPGQSGYRGRLGLYELVVVDHAMRERIHAGASEAALTEQARRQTRSLWSMGVDAVLAGQTSVEELLRVTVAQ